MRVELIHIGNSRGIRIPKPLIDQAGLGDAVDLRLERNRLVIERERRPREGWDAAFQSAGSAVDDELLLESVAPNRFDSEEWRW